VYGSLRNIRCKCEIRIAEWFHHSSPSSDRRRTAVLHHIRFPSNLDWEHIVNQYSIQSLQDNIPIKSEREEEEVLVEKPLMDKYVDMISPSRTDFLHNPSFEPSDENLEYHTFEDARGDRLK
jgi:hypothetical protein